MNFEFQPKLTKELILSKYSEEQLMEHYLGVPIKKGLFRSPLRNDMRPTCSIYRNGDLIFKDFATGQHLNIFGVVQEKYNCDYYKALRIIANDFGILKGEKVEVKEFTRIQDKELADIKIEIQDFSKSELEWWNKYNITLDTLNKFNVYSCKHVFLNNELFAESSYNCPIYGYYGGKIKENGKKIELWKCYFPSRKTYRFIGNYPSKKLQGYDKLPKKGKVCVITKSMKDVLSLYSFGIPACAPNSEVIIPSEAIVKDLTSRFNYVFCLWDNDRTGVSFLLKIRKKYPQLHCFIIPRRLGAKDFSDLVEKYGTNKTSEFIKEFINYFKKCGYTLM